MDFTLKKTCYLAILKGMAQMVAEKKQTNILKFQDEDTRKETIQSQGGSHGKLQGEFQRASRNLHFMKSPTTMTTMGITFVITFEVEVVELDLK